MSAHSLTGTPAAERVEQFLNARTREDDKITTERTVASHRNGRINYDLHDLTVSDLRQVLAELHEYQQAVAAVLDVPEQAGAGDYNRALDDVRAALATHVTGLEA